MPRKGQFAERVAFEFRWSQISGRSLIFEAPGTTAHRNSGETR